MTLQDQLQDDLKTAMRAGDKLRVGVIRMTLAALKNAQMAQVKAAFDAAGGEAAGEAAQVAAASAGTLNDAAMQDVLAKEVKRRRESAEAYHKGNRTDLAAEEEAEAAVLEGYLPAQLSADELRPLIAATISSLGVSGVAQIGKVMPALMAQFKGRADGKLISQIAREVLQQ